MKALYVFSQGASEHDNLELGASATSMSRESEAMSNYPWYIGKKSRIEAEQALHKMKDGVFVIRESDVRDGEYAIALKSVSCNLLVLNIKTENHNQNAICYYGPSSFVRLLN